MATPPPGWPYSGWLQSDELLVAIEEGELKEILRILLPLQEEAIVFIKGFLKRETSNKVIIGYGGTSHLAARARRTEPPGGYAIALDAATYLQLYFTFRRLLAVSALLPGQTELPRSPVEPKPSFVQVYSGQLYFLFDGDPASPSLADSRYALCRQLIVDAMAFIFLHEYAHIVEGHIDYRLAQNINRQFLPRVEREKLETADSLRLEHLADIWAAVEGARLVAASAASQFVEKQGDARSFLSYRLECFGVAAGVVFLLEETIERYLPVKRTLPPRGTHPSASARALVCQSFLLKAEMLRTEDPNNSVLKGMLMSLDAWDALGWSRGELAPEQSPRELFQSLITLLDELPAFKPTFGA